MRRPLLLLLILAVPGSALGTSLSVLTYNVAGLPGGLSSSRPQFNTVQISPRLNDFDLAVVQEDFSFHTQLVSAAAHPFISVKDTRDVPLLAPLNLHLGDGLNTFSFSPFWGFTRVTWNECFGELGLNGSDCAAFKGFTFARHEVEPGVVVDVYNLHADASGSPEDLEARRSQMRQLADFIVATSADRAVIVLGDTNSRYTRAGDILPELLATTGLSDVWIELSRGGDIPAVGPALQDCSIDLAGPDCERVDKIFYRSGSKVELTALEHEVFADWVDADGLNPEGGQLSDHWPVSAVFDVVFVPEPAAGALLALGIAALAARRYPRARCRPSSSATACPGSRRPASWGS